MPSRPLTFVVMVTSVPFSSLVTFISSWSMSKPGTLLVPRERVASMIPLSVSVHVKRICIGKSSLAPGVVLAGRSRSMNASGGVVSSVTGLDVAFRQREAIATVPSAV